MSGSKPGERRGGRQKGTANKRTREIADRAAAEGITPLEVMLKAMRLHAADESWDKAAAIAEKAAPYMHPRLASVAHTGKGGGPISFVNLKDLTDEQLAALEPVLSALAASGDAAEGSAG